MSHSAPPTGQLPWTRGGEVLGGVTGLHGITAAVGLAMGLPVLAGIGGLLFCLSLAVWIAHLRSQRVPADVVAIAGVVVHGVFGTVALGPESGAQGFLLVLPALALVDQALPVASRLARAAVALGVYAAFVFIMTDIPPLWRLPGAELELLAECARVATLGVVGGLAWAAARNQEQRRARERRAAETDPLTGVLRRTPVLQRARTLQAELRQSGKEISVAVVDLEGLHAAQLLGGPDATDALLQETASRLELCLRQADLIGRLGPAEFLLVMPGLDGRRAFGLLERLHKATGRPVSLPDGRQLHSQVRVGLVGWTGDELIEECIARADAAVYRDRSADGLAS